MTDAGAPAPEVYRLSMEKLPLAKGRAGRIAVVQVVAAVTAVVALSEAALGGTAATDVSLVAWGLAAILLPYVRWRAGQRVRRRWNAFELSIGPTNMRCAARGSGRVTLRLDEISSITEGASGLVVWPSRAGVPISIPRTVEGYLNVRARLGAVRPVTPRPDALVWCSGLVATGLLLALTVGIWDHGPSLAFAVLGLQGVASGIVAIEIWWHPRLLRRGKLTAFAALAVGFAVPVATLIVREATR